MASKIVDSLKLSKFSLVQNSLICNYNHRSLWIVSFRGFDENIEGKYELRAKGPQVSLLGPYTIAGKILILPIQGEGQSNITISEYHVLTDVLQQWTEF